MNQTYPLIPRPGEAIELYEPRPRIAYTIEATAQITDLPRHAILVYYKSGLISPVAGPEGGGYCFDDAAIRTLRRIGQLRSMPGMGISGIKLILELMDEVERLQTELRFLRDYAHSQTRKSKPE
jgi:DNA-binding transcriptional MerR regulator